jgi:hypothetical protein
MVGPIGASLVRPILPSALLDFSQQIIAYLAIDAEPGIALIEA